MCPYLVRLTVGDLSLAEGPVVALPAYPEEGMTPWTWDCRLLGTHTQQKLFLPFLSPQRCENQCVIISTRLKTQSKSVQVITQNLKSRSLIPTTTKWRRAPEKKLTGNSPSLAFYTNLLKESICRPLVRILPFYHQKVTETWKVLCIANLPFKHDNSLASNLTYFHLSFLQLFSRDVGKKKKKKRKCVKE